MRSHTASELRYTAQIIASDGSTVLGTARAGVKDLAGRLLAQAQLTMPETTHLIVMRVPDASAFKDSCYIVCQGLTYVVDFHQDPRSPEPGMWLEVYCHVERAAS